MDIIQIIILALVQGISEFLPISSSAHLILVPLLTEWQDQGLAFDVAVHVGTLFAVVSYFYKDIQRMLIAWTQSISTRQMSGDARIAWGIALGTIPVGLVGLFGKDFIEASLRSPLVIATTTIVFGVLLWVADIWGKRLKSEYDMRWLDIFWIGCAQALALIPGTSRSGITMTAALLLGFTRDAAARFSFLLSIPVITLAGMMLIKDLVTENHPVDWTALALGVVLSALSAWLCIHYFLRFLSKIGMLPFMVYRLILGAFLFVMFWPW